MNFRELPEFQTLYSYLVEFSQDEKASSYYHYKGKTKKPIKAIIQKWLDENEIEAEIRLEGLVYNRASDKYWRTPYNCITVEYIQIHNGKGSLDNKSRWLNKITVHPAWVKGGLLTAMVNSVARTDKDFLEPTPSNFRDFIHSLFDALTIREKQDEN